VTFFETQSTCKHTLHTQLPLSLIHKVAASPFHTQKVVSYDFCHYKVSLHLVLQTSASGLVTQAQKVT